MSDLEDLGRVKGSTVVPIILWMRANMDEDTFQARLSRARPEVRDRLDAMDPQLGLVPGVWYPAQIIHDVVDHVLLTDVAPRDVSDMTRTAADVAYDALISGLHKAVFRLFVSPRTYARHIQRLWSLNFDNGVIEVEEVKPGHQRNVITNWRSYHHNLLLINNHYKSRIFKLMGCKDVSFDIEPAQDGRNRVVTNTYWTP